jgi:hypothetical protein
MFGPVTGNASPFHNAVKGGQVSGSNIPIKNDLLQIFNIVIFTKGLNKDSFFWRILL